MIIKYHYHSCDLCVLLRNILSFLRVVFLAHFFSVSLLQELSFNHNTISLASAAIHNKHDTWSFRSCIMFICWDGSCGFPITNSFFLGSTRGRNKRLLESVSCNWPIYIYNIVTILCFSLDRNSFAFLYFFSSSNPKVKYHLLLSIK